ncbi:MAG TPA: L,D-transpeptidase [Gemmatimonadaceae bacterium]|nr:L,D-transpeptidase [Gemmatimonadaceae bacterium]
MIRVAVLLCLTSTWVPALGVAQLPERVPPLATAPADTLTNPLQRPVVDSSTARPSLSATAPAAVARFTTRRDSLEWESARALARRATGFRIEISLQDRMLWTIVGKDTLLRAPIAVATGDVLSYEGRTWKFTTPRGIRRVLNKKEDPVWSPPDWHYAEVALMHGLRLRSLEMSRPYVLYDGSRIEVRNGEVGLVLPGAEFAPLPLDEHIVFDNTLFIPPLESKNRAIQGELGHHMLDLGNGYLLHGTPHTYTIGTAATHGCIRLHDEDIQWLYTFVPVGTNVYIY